MKKRTLAIVAMAWAIVVTIVASSLVTMMLTDSGSAGNRAITDEELAIVERYSRLEEVRKIVSENYYKELDDDVLVQGAIDGMLAAIEDPYTFYYTVDDMIAQSEEQEGKYHGIGASVTMDGEGHIRIVRVFKDSPAYKAGLLAGDLIYAIDDTVLDIQTAKDLDDAVTLMRGEDDTEVTLTIMRKGVESQITCRRGDVVINYVEYSIIEGNIGYLQLYQFMGDCDDMTAEAIEYFKEQNVSGVIIDLRDNPGGLLTSVVNIADMFLPKGRVIYTEDRAGNISSYYSSEEHWDIPLVVLINGQSASASEILAAAIQDYERGTLIGTTSFGKGIVQLIMGFPDGAGMQYTESAYYTPSGRTIHGVGVEPDITVELSETYDPSLYEPSLENDNQLAAAVEELRKISE